MSPLKDRLLNLLSSSSTSEKALQEKAKLLERTLETIRLGVTITDCTGKILYTNPAEASMHGYEVSELLNQDIRILSPKELWHPLSVATVIELKQWQRDSINIRKDGSRFPVHLKSDLLLDDDGSTIGIVTTCEDITERNSTEAIAEILRISEERAKAKAVVDLELAQEVAERRKIEAELRETAQTLQALILASPLAIIMLNPDETVKIWNPAAQRIFGWREQEVIGNRLPIFPDEVQNADQPNEDELWGKAFASPSTLQIRLDDAMETRRKRKDGTPVDVRISAAPLFNEDGEMHGSMAVIADITEHKRAEQQLRSSEEKLRALSLRLQLLQEEERGKIAREIHDEFGQALTALKIDLSWINQRLSKEQEHLQAKIEKMSQLIDSTIQLVRAIATQLRPTILDDLGLVAATEWAVREFQSRTEIECDLTIESEYISLDSARATTIFRILQESLTNIARHANASKVEIILKQEDEQISLEVRDNGQGITETEISNPKSLGLIGMKERVVPWQGTVNIQGKVGVGTTISVHIPFINFRNYINEDISDQNFGS